MNRLLLSFVAFAAVALSGASANAQATRTWVSGVGDDANPCSRTAPCKTFAGAISKTATSGEINCIDPGSFGAVTITKSITIDCHEIQAGITASGTTGIIINASAGNVNLRNLNLNGVTTGTRGISIVAASKVTIDNLLISGFTQQGIADVRTDPGSLLLVKDSTVRNNTGAGIAVASAATSGAVIENVTSTQNGYGVAVGNGNNVVVKRTMLSNNVNAGVATDPGGAISVENSTVSHSATGIVSNGPVRLSGNVIAFNNTAFSGAAISTYGNNRTFGNGSLGVTPTAAGAASTALGLQ